jgi:glucose/arabinose dehydrogenase
MSKKRLELVLLIIIGIEILVAAGLIVWAVFFRDNSPSVPATQTPKTSTKAPEPSPLVPVIQPQLYAEGFTRPTTIAFTDDPTDKRLFVTEGQGTIRIVNGDGKLAADPLLDIKPQVLDKGEMGLLGLAFHPDFKKSGYFYVNYIDKGQNTIISRFKVSKQTGLADPASEKVLIKLKQPYPNHNGGILMFGPDGYLYIGLGDGGSSGDPDNRAQNKGDLLGKILRIDVDHGDPYATPASNPFKGQSAAKPEVWAYGLRNPWRLSFDRTTGDMFIADVGQNKYEEIDFQKASSKGGENYGWRCYEGLHEFNTEGCQPAGSYVAPILEYDHADKRCSVTGGFIYRGTVYPAMQGKYFYADICGGQLYYAAPKKDGKWQETLAASTQLHISTFGEDAAGELYATDIETGKLYHLTDTAVH